MPVFRFQCLVCEQDFKKLLPKRQAVACPGGCNRELDPLLPESTNSTTMEMKDPHRGKSLPKGHREMMMKRMNQHHDKYEAERKIDEFGIDDAKRLGWDKKVKRT